MSGKNDFPLNDCSAEVKNNHDMESQRDPQKLKTRSRVDLNSDLHMSEHKRRQSIKQRINDYKKQCFAVKAALGNLDRKKSNKIIFNENGDIFKTEDQKKNKKRKVLFESDDEEQESFNFDLKNHFNSSEGQQLLELQSKFKGDKRFMLSDRFVTHNELKTNNSTAPEFSVEEEKRNEIAILEQVLSTNITVNDSNLQSSKCSQQKKMLRFDPMHSDHLQYQITSTNNTATTQLQHNDEHHKENTKKQLPVSKDVFYKVSDDLKDTLQTQQEFSLLNLFSKAEKTEQNEANEVQPIVINNRSNLYLEHNPFIYDSSEDELDLLKGKHENAKVYSQVNADVQSNASRFLHEAFFFKDDDFRLQEGSDFVKRVASTKNTEFTEQRRNLKHVIKTKVRKNNKKNTLFKKKLGGSKKKKNFRMKKALKR